MANSDARNASRVQCWRNYGYFMLKQYLEKVGEGLFTHACISSLVITD
jgi:hypothetical protein